MIRKDILQSLLVLIGLILCLCAELGVIGYLAVDIYRHITEGTPIEQTVKICFAALFGIGIFVYRLLKQQKR